MMRRPAALLSLFLACSPAAPAPGTTQPAAGNPPAGNRPAFPRTQLGTVEAGGTKFDVFQLEPIVAGGTGDFDLDFAAGAAFPPAIRGWVGIESGEGSVKVRFDKETATRLHGHPEIPKPLPEGSRFWVEVELANGQKPRVGLGLK
jgi:hypothetical protein